MGIKQIFQEGMQEWRRKSSVNKGKRDLKGKERVYGDQLTALGKKAWESKLTIDSYGDVKDALANTQKQQDDLKALLDELQKKKLETEETKKQQNEQFDKNRKEIEEKKKGVDSRLNEEKNALKAAQKESEQASSRLAQIPKDRENLNKKSVDPATPEPEKTQVRDKLSKLGTEEDELKRKYQEKTDAIKGLSEKIAPIQEESDGLQKQIDEIKAEQKKVIGELDKTLADNKKDTDANNTKLKEADNVQLGNFKQLGEKLVAANVSDANVADEMTAIRATEKDMADINSQVGSLENQKSEASAGAYKKMIAIIIGGVLLIIAIIVALVILLSPKKPADPLSQLMSQMGKNSPSGDIQDLAKQMEKGLGGLKEQSENIQGKKIAAADEGTLKSVLPNVGGWNANNPSYSKGAFGEIETANVHATYIGPDSKEVHVEVTDTASVSALLMPVKMIFSMNLSVDNDEKSEKISTYNGTPVIESYDKRTQEASFGFILKDRYIIGLRTKSENGPDLLKQFMSKMDLSKLQ
jgi:hypothetical protein